MKKYFTLAASVLALTSCNKEDIVKGTPDCIKQQIRIFSKSSACGDANVKKYTFQGKKVYVFDQSKCGADMTSEVVGENCATIGYLGGIVGITTIEGEEFSNAVYEETVWEK